MYRILIADDEPIERMVITKTILKYFGEQLEVVQAVNGREVLALYETKPCDIMILDIEMPGINGLEAAKKIREKDKKCQIIFLTAFDQFSYAKQAIAVRALDYLLKPSHDEELIAVIEEAIRLTRENTLEHPIKQQLVEDTKVITPNKMEQVRLSSVQEAILKYIHNYYKEDLSLQDVANAMNYSDVYFCKLFKQCFDKSFTTYLAEFRVDKAKELLMDITINVKEISGRVGYRDSNYFAKVFKRIVGITPSEYRNSLLEKHG